VNFLVDAQLPRRIAGGMTAGGCDTIHTLDLPDGNRTTDQQIIDVADREQRAVVIPAIDREFQAHSFLELGRAGIIVRG
jgi:predicted nuclease of predicted toxin-antitoxin system